MPPALTPARRVRCGAALLLAALTARSAAAAPAVQAPRPVQQVEAAYPLAAASSSPQRVELLVTVGVDGGVGEVTVASSAGPAFDAAAIAAVRQWRFTPATQGGAPVAARIRVPFVFPPPLAEPAPPAPVPSDIPASPVPAASSPAPTRPVPSASPSAPVPAASSPAPVAPAPSDSPTQPVPSASTSAPVPTASAPAPVAPVPSDSSTQPVPSAGSAPSPGDEGVIEVSTHGRRPPPPRAASDFVLGPEVLNAAPKQSSGDMLTRAPGVYVSRPEGDAVAHEIYLRGFNAAHGQDIEFTVGGAPINQISHLHGQGYADLNFILPEVVRSIRVTEGVYDPHQGDFAVAGSIDFDLGVAQRGFLLRSTGGSFGTFRQLAMWAPRGQSEETFAAAAIRRSSGFGMNRGALSGTGLGQFAFTGPGGLAGKLMVAAHAARAGMAGVLRNDDVEAGRVGFYDRYPDPGAGAQSASAARGQLGLELTHRSETGGRTLFAAHAALVDFHSRENFTGYLQRSMVMPAWVGRGDLIEQQNRDLGGGFRLSHRTGWWRPARWFAATLELGSSARIHRVRQAQNLLQAPSNETWDHRVDAEILATDVGLFADLELRFGKYVQLRGGARADVLHYDIDDHLGNFIAPYQVASHLVGYRRTATGVAAGPRVALEVTPLPWLKTFVAYGQGYRSPQARQLEEGERAPFTKVHSVEGGVRLAPRWRRPVELTAAGYGTFLAQDLAFDPEEGRLEKIGPTRRSGVVAALQTRPWPWLQVSTSVTYVHAILTAPPPATVEDPNPAYVAGQLLPYVPPVVVRLDLGVSKDLVQLGAHPLAMRLGGGFNYLSARPLPYGQSSDPLYLLDASASLRWSWIELGVEAYNLLARRYAASVYSFVSDWGTTPVPSRLPARHFAAGPPLSVLGTLTLSF
ncbi:TonB-dependent receptor [Nannocystis sp.]|uniref:TonB-dependent receptor domain-containing protein n=1 Tax=Nannocystis sp. TaxID=1962667 RepID=UPI0025F91451|nr:TonB-dependent receptor [Nannocystis sp.]MBK7827656.1 TonB-dependent receptor [Nannocystis sp.]